MSIKTLLLYIGIKKYCICVVSENLLFTSGLIAAPLYSALMATFILMKPIIIGDFSRFVASIKDSVN